MRPTPRSLALPLLLGLGAQLEAVPPTLGSLDADRRGAFENWDYNISVFAERVDSLFRFSPAGLREELRARLDYAREQGRAEYAALGEMTETLRELASLAPRVPDPKRPDPRVPRTEALVEALTGYLRLFDESLHRALGTFPTSHPQRLLARWRRGEEPRLLVAVERSVRERVPGLVSQLASLQELRRKRLYDAVHALQLTGAPLDLDRQSQVDRAFASLQAGYRRKLEPGLGDPEYRDFPVGDPFTVELSPRGSDHARGLGEVPFPEGREPGRVSSPLVHRVQSEEALRRGAHRARELHELAARFPEALAGRAPERLPALWEGYRDLRERWFRVP